MIQDPVLKNGWGVGPFKIIRMSSREATAQPKIKIQGGEKRSLGGYISHFESVSPIPLHPLCLRRARYKEIKTCSSMNMERFQVPFVLQTTLYLVPRKKGKKQTNLNKPSYLLLVFAFEVSGFKFGQHFQVTGRKLLNFVQDKIFSI